MKIQRDELMVLLNNIYEEDSDFEIRAKLKMDEKDKPIAWIDLKEDYAEIQIISEKEYDDLALEHAEILPDSSDYVTSLVSSGILKLKDWEEQYEKIAMEFRKSIYDRQRPLYISFDTNCFINRISYHLEQYMEHGAFVIADGVRKELFKEIAGRYSEHELRLLMRKDQRFKHFLNQPKVKERIRKIGRAEYNRFKISVTLEEIPSGIGDNEIAEALGNFARARNCDIWLITFDKNMYEVAAGFGIRPILFEFPRLREKVKVKASWENICDLIYTTAVIFGFINISGIHIYGIWTGKNPEDWNEERVLIALNGKERIAKKIEKDLNILKEIRPFVKF